MRTTVRIAQPQRRGGFSLLELLVVVSLILFLMTILVMTLGNSIGTAKERATLATLIKIDGMLQQRIDAFYVNFEKATKRGEIAAVAESQDFRKYLSNNGMQGMPGSLFPILVQKQRFRGAFPQTGATVGSVGADSPGLVQAGAAFSGNLQNESESAEYLYYMLIKSDYFGVAPVEESEFSSTEVGDVDGDGRLEFVDAWGKPLRFYRWPTRIVRPRGLSFAPDQALAKLLIGGIPTSAATVGDNDPWTHDPDDQLSAFSRVQLSRTSDPAAVAASFETAFHTLQTYHCPLVVSAGRDGKLGLLEPYDRSSTFGYLAQPEAIVPNTPAYTTMLDRVSDNITSRNVKTR